MRKTWLKTCCWQYILGREGCNTKINQCKQRVAMRKQNVLYISIRKLFYPKHNNKKWHMDHQWFFVYVVYMQQLFLCFVLVLFLAFFFCLMKNLDFWTSAQQYKMYAKQYWCLIKQKNLKAWLEITSASCWRWHCRILLNETLNHCTILQKKSTLWLLKVLIGQKAQK